MPVSAIARQNAWRASMERYFSRGNETMNELVSRLGGNPSAGLLEFGDAGVPTSGVPFIANGVPVIIPGPAAAPPSAWNPETFLPFRGLRLRAGDGRGSSAACVYPQRQPLATVFPSAPVQPVAASVPVTIPVPALVPPPAPSLPAAAPCPDPSECAPTAANVCANLRNGCYLGSQLSPDQVLACSRAGYAGNLNKYPCVLLKGGWGGGQFIGSPNLAPDPYKGAGVGGVLTTQPGAGVFWASVGLAAFGLYAAREFSRPKGKR